MQDAGGLDDVDRERVGVYVGCGMGGASSLETAYRGARVPPLTIPGVHAERRRPATSRCATACSGPVLTYSVACASSAVAIAEAAAAVERGDLDVAIAGGSEALIVPGVVVAWQAMQTLGAVEPGHESEAVRPFAKDRSGFALGEGAAFLILESEARARRAASERACAARRLGHVVRRDAPDEARCARPGARPPRRVAPRGTRARATSATATRTAPRPASATSSNANALADVWGDDVDDLQVSSTKALHGHLLGAAGALEALVTVLAVRDRRLPPNMHCAEVDEACRLNLVAPDEGDAPALQAAISNSFAFGGTNSVLLFTRA